MGRGVLLHGRAGATAQRRARRGAPEHAFRHGPFAVCAPPAELYETLSPPLLRHSLPRPASASSPCPHRRTSPRQASASESRGRHRVKYTATHLAATLCLAAVVLYCSAAAAGKGDVVPMQLAIDDRRVDSGTIVKIAPGETLQLQVDIVRPGGTRESVSYNHRTRYVSLTPSLIRVDRSGRVQVAAAERSVQPDGRENSLATVRVQYGVEPETGESAEEYATSYVTFRIAPP